MYIKNEYVLVNYSHVQESLNIYVQCHSSSLYFLAHTEKLCCNSMARVLQFQCGSLLHLQPVENSNAMSSFLQSFQKGFCMKLVIFLEKQQKKKSNCMMLTRQASQTLLWKIQVSSTHEICNINPSALVYNLPFINLKYARDSLIVIAYLYIFFNCLFYGKALDIFIIK